MVKKTHLLSFQTCFHFTSVKQRGQNITNNIVNYCVMFFSFLFSAHISLLVNTHHRHHYTALIKITYKKFATFYILYILFPLLIPPYSLVHFSLYNSLPYILTNPKHLYSFYHFLPNCSAFRPLLPPSQGHIAVVHPANNRRCVESSLHFSVLASPFYRCVITASQVTGRPEAGRGETRR